MDKQALLKAILGELEAELKLLTEAANLARDEATNDESRAEDRFDMRSQSAAYLAAGQAKMAGETEAAIEAYQSFAVRTFAENDLIATCALVTLEAQGGRRTQYFIGIQRGGLEVSVGGAKVLVLTGSSPLGHQLIGRRLGDTVLLPGKVKPVEHKIVRVE
jgi:transcription elongation GreA/GreB family factor